MSSNQVPSDLWTWAQAESYDDSSDERFSSGILETTTAFLADLAGSGPALELAIGTGRVAIPLRERGVEVHGIELSEAMAAVLRRKTRDIPVVIGDMATMRVAGEFSLVYLVFNTIGNLYTQQAQVECFRNAARHLAPGGRFVVEVGVPPLRLLPPTQIAVPFDVSGAHIGFDTFDLATQRAVSHHYFRREDGAFNYSPHNYRFVWPSELDLMAQLAGLEHEARYGDWDLTPFTAESTSHVSVWRLPVDDRPAGS